MKLGLIVGALAVALGGAACGGGDVNNCEPNGYCPSNPTLVNGSGGASGQTSPDDAGADDGSTPTGTETSSSSGSSSGATATGSSSGGSNTGTLPSSGGTCIPGAACGGIYECTDDCYTQKCCTLDCYCSNSTGQTGTLECSMSCP